MKKTFSVGTFILLIFIFLTLAYGCKKDKDKISYLRTVLKNLDQIESASYYSMREPWAPGDTAPAFTMLSYYKEYSNHLDSTIGASFVCLLPSDTTQMTFCYDGKMRATVYEEDKTIIIDSFNLRKLPFRPLTPPFFNYTKSIIKYALETKDSISINIEEKKDFVYFCLTIFENQQVEFFGKAYYIENTPYNFGETTSKYEIWIDKSTDLPYKDRREMSHDISSETVSNVLLNKLKIEDFKASNYFMPDFAIVAYGSWNKSKKINDLIGEIAPDWVLNDASNNAITLKQLKSSVILLEFTSVSCGPCLASIQFLKKLASEYNNKDFDFVSIESWAKNSNVLKSYQRRNDFNYKFVMSTDEITKKYQIRSVPVFYILDKSRVVRKIIDGYRVGTTDTEIRNAINALI